MKTIEKIYLTNINAEKKSIQNPKIMRAILCRSYTQIDFGYVAPWIYVRGGWIHIDPSTYLQVIGSEKKYKLIDAKNIPIAPQKHNFESIEDWCVFSLIFETIPLKSCCIDIIEADNPSTDDFNYYNIKIDFQSAYELNHTDQN